MISIVVPTYNERENIEALLKEIFEALKSSRLEGEVIVVDDDSPDLTWKTAQELKDRHGYNLKVLKRQDKKGLSPAVIDGFKIAGGDVKGVMDADFSHPPALIPELIKPIINGEAELVIGSRYIQGGGIENWPATRKIISRAAILLAKPLAGNVNDPVSGFFFFRKDIIDGLELDPQGFKILVEIIVKGKYSRAIEVPYVFINRKQGKSKFGLNEVTDYLLHLKKLYAGRYFIQERK